jgi:outer membrane protein TolC
MLKLLKTGCFLLLFQQIGFSQILTLETCYEQAEKNHPSAAQRTMINDALEMQTKQLNRNYLPQFAVNGQASWQSQVIEINLPLPGFNFDTPAKDQYRLTLDMNQTIWDGGINAKQKELAKSAAQTDQGRLEVELWNIRRQVHQFYFGALLADNQRAQITTLRTDLLAKRKRVADAIENGVAIKSDLLRFDAKLLELQQQENELISRKKSALEGLSLLTGNNIDSNFSLASPKALAKNGEKVTRPELNLFDAQKNLIESQIKFIQVKNNPKFGAFAQGGFGRPGFNMLSNAFQPFFIGGIRLQVPLTHFYSGQSGLEIKQLKVQNQRIDRQKESFLLANEIQTKQLQNEINRLEQLLESDKELLSLREKILKTAEEQWQNGVTTANDYLEEVNQVELILQKIALHEVLLAQTGQELSWILGSE